MRILRAGETQEIMGIRHREWDLEGVQFRRKLFSANKDTLCWKISSGVDLWLLVEIFYSYFVIIIQWHFYLTGW
ncbi:hypothetical protein KCP70_08900 [Salmonella enterica subsp. enterica]|nr:hypothetical protein KCP70_08900 [Salmonella enterica subsp. enterica]